MAPLEVEIIGDNQVDPPTNTHSTEQSDLRYWPRMEEINELFGYKPNRDAVNDVRTILLTVAALMATATYQAVLSPPGGVWQDNNNGHSAGKSIMATESEVSFCLFILGNSIGFYTSFYIIVLLTNGIPLQYPLVLLLFSISFNYSGSMVSLVPTVRSYVAASLAIAFGYLAPFFPSVIRRIRSSS